MEPAKQTARGAPETWWMNPIWILGALVIPAYAIIYLIPYIFGWDAIALHGFSFFTFNYFLLGLLFVAAILNGVVIGKSRLGRPLLSSSEPLRFHRYYLDVLALATIAAYLIWFRGVFFSPSGL